ncbi:MAG: Hpt domain-containing protein [Rhodospirillales bacterium]|nr:Hpt domain-containing protein [Alphaproteobacteria bacterium]MBL6948650.1 Hpt domain-containing protein [Rhodospirillales bacterium]
MTSADEELLAKIKILQDAFKANLEDRLAEVDAALDSLRTAGEDNADALNHLMGLAHKLTGSAGTFGFPATSDAAGELETLCESLEKAGGDASAHFDRIAALVDGLRQAAAGETV